MTATLARIAALAFIGVVVSVWVAGWWGLLAYALGGFQVAAIVGALVREAEAEKERG